MIKTSKSGRISWLISTKCACVCLFTIDRHLFLPIFILETLIIFPKTLFSRRVYVNLSSSHPFYLFFLSLFVWVFFLLNKNTDLDATNIFLSKISFRNTASMAGRDRSNCAWQKTRSLRKLCLISQWMGLTVKFLRGAIGSKFRSGYALLNREICESRDANWNGKER